MDPPIRAWDFKRFREIADSVGAYLMVDMAHFAGLVAGGVHPIAGAARPCRHHHHAQVAARPARRPDPVHDEATRQEAQFGSVPRPAGRPADACYRGKGGRARRGADARVQALCEECRRQCQRAGRDAESARASISFRRHRQ